MTLRLDTIHKTIVRVMTISSPDIDGNKQKQTNDVGVGRSRPENG